ncbi:hypothetical protein EV363DRAFT_1302838 [Boletus edulis]|nr:hypothetical protein EV363DRAFT_1302838 [Boletus edulis]
MLPTLSSLAPIRELHRRHRELQQWQLASIPPGSLEMANFETYMFQNKTIDARFLNTTITRMRGQDTVPVIGADARSVRRIYKQQLRSRSMWTHNKNITYGAAFVPQDAPGGETYKDWLVDLIREAYPAANEHGHMMVGSISAGVSIGAASGWLASGARSVLLSPSYGLGVDNALEISVVLSTGEYLITNEYRNSDLFWTLRGGGGRGTMIITSAAYRTYPAVPFKVWLYQANTTNSSALPGLFKWLIDEGLGGFGGAKNWGISFLNFGLKMTNDYEDDAAVARLCAALGAVWSCVFERNLDLMPTEIIDVEEWDVLCTGVRHCIRIDVPPTPRKKCSTKRKPLGVIDLTSSYPKEGPSTPPTIPQGTSNDPGSEKRRGKPGEEHRGTNPKQVTTVTVSQKGPPLCSHTTEHTVLYGFGKAVQCLQ